MGLFEVASILITLAALFSYLNCRYFRLPTTIGVMLMSLAASLAVIALGSVAPSFRTYAGRLVAGIDFHQALLHGMLAFLLFAGSLHLDLADLGREWDTIGILSLFGTAASTFAVAALSWAIFRDLGLAVSWIDCLAFGALISPTDPIAVLGIMRKVGASRRLETLMAGESLFNDGIGVVLFLTVAQVAAGDVAWSWSQVTLLLVRQAVGGALFGLATGILVYQLLRRVDNYQVEVLLTLALAMGGYTAAELLHLSAPIANVVAGLFIGNRGRTFGMSRITEEHLDTFWELVDEILNALLFLLIGLEVLVMPFTTHLLWAGLTAVGITLVARWLTVAGTIGAMRRWRRFEPGTVIVLTWGGLRGGLSVAMALSLPPGGTRDLILAATYCVVIFSIFAQGLTAAPLIRRIARTSHPAERVTPVTHATN